MLKRTLTALALVGMAATPAAADLLVPDQLRVPANDSGTGAIGLYGASVNGVPVIGAGFLGGGTAGQVSIPANPSDTIQVTFAFRWPFSWQPGFRYLGIQWQNRLLYDNSEVQVLGATGVGGWTAENFGLGVNNSKMSANASTATMVGVSGTPLKGFPNPTSGIISTAPGFGRFAVNAPNTISVGFGIPHSTVSGATRARGMLLSASSIIPIMRITLRVQSSVIGDNLVDLLVPPSSAFMVYRQLTFTTIIQARTPLSFTGSQVGLNGVALGADIVPEPASATLMGIGLFSLVGGAWRRQRRFRRSLSYGKW